MSLPFVRFWRFEEPLKEERATLPFAARWCFEHKGSKPLSPSMVWPRQRPSRDPVVRSDQHGSIYRTEGQEEQARPRADR